jgi:hypothetical protein
MQQSCESRVEFPLSFRNPKGNYPGGALRRRSIEPLIIRIFVIIFVVFRV